MQINVILPCRAGSERVRDKNTRPFTADGRSLLEVKLQHLTELNFVDEVVISTNDAEVVRQATSFSSQKLRVDKRPDSLCASSTRIQDLASYLGKVVGSEHFLWTHVTSPFFGPENYEKGFSLYSDGLGLGFDSLVSVTEIQDFLFFQDEPLNFGDERNYWPRTQDLEPALRVNSAAFIGPTWLLAERNNRIGDHPFFMKVDRLSSLDVDSYDDFTYAQSMESWGNAPF